MTRAALGVLALAYTLAHAPFVVSTLEDIDSVNFALGIRDFDVAKHQPHPPGYPVYVALGKVGVATLRAFGLATGVHSIEARTLSILSLIGAVVSVFLLYRIMACWSTRPPLATSLDEADASPDPLRPPWHAFDPLAAAATALVVACPLFWYLGVRPMSDLPGLAAALAAQAALALAWWRQRADAAGDGRLRPDRLAASGRMIVFGCLLSGIAIGFRSQNAMLTLPLVLGVLADRIGRGVAGALVGGGVAFAVGVLSWAVPLVIASGGPNAYLAALGSQAGEDFAGVEMLYLTPSPRLVAWGLLRTFVYPWDSMLLGGLVTTLAIVGAAVLLMRDSRSLIGVSLLLFPYLAFHLLFQDTAFVRYALPLVPPTVFLAVYGLQAMLRQAAYPVIGGLGLWAVVIATPVLAAYGGETSPTARVVVAMHDALADETPGALGLHQTFRRPLEAETISVEPQLASPPRREWLEVARYWREGHDLPLWFLGDPRRSDLALIDPQSRSIRRDFSWQLASLSEVGGMRPAAVSWYRMPPPGWFAEEGWALTPETAGMARLMGRGPALGPITAWVRRRQEPAHIVIGGRHLGVPTDPPVVFEVALDGRSLSRWEVAPGFFVHEIELPAGALAGQGPLARLTVQSTSSAGGSLPTAVEQFDLQGRGTMMWAYDEGWHEAEYAPVVGLWRWTSERARLRIINARTALALTLRVERPRRYFDDDPVVRLSVAGRVLGETRFRESESWRVQIPLDALEAAAGRVVLETDRTFVPAERTGAADQRALGLRVLGVDVSPLP